MPALTWGPGAALGCRRSLSQPDRARCLVLSTRFVYDEQAPAVRGRRFDFVANSMYAFRVGLDSYHGFDGGAHISGDRSRDSIILTFARSTEQWDLRPSQRLECSSRPFLCPRSVSLRVLVRAQKCERTQGWGEEV